MNDNNEVEIWKDIEGFSGLYQISNLGNVKSLSKKVNSRFGLHRNVRERVMKATDRGNGYLCVCLCKDGSKELHSVHILVATHFINNPDNKPEVNHIGGNTKDNRWFKLEWATRQENIDEAFERGAWDNMNNKYKGVLNRCAKLNDEKVRDIRNIYNEGNISIRKLAAKYGVTHSGISDIIHKRKWAHVQ